jgi:hypothetical protein
VWRSVFRIPRAARQRIASHRVRRYMARRRLAARAPYELRFYRELLVMLREQPVAALPAFASRAPTPGQARIFVRYDVDTPQCLARLTPIVDVGLAERVSPAVYVRADGREYALEAHRESLRELAASGVHVGLHSSCYLEDDYLAELRREIDGFAKALGSPPETLTVHGMGSHRSEVRAEFVQEVVLRLPEFGFSFTDCHPALRSYAYVIEDCHWDEESSGRFIYDDFLHPPPLRNEESYLVLIHPGYWGAE